MHSLNTFLLLVLSSFIFASKSLQFPFKKGGQREIEYFTYDEICSILEHIDQSKWIGKRDFALILFMFNTGARAQEVVDLRGEQCKF